MRISEIKAKREAFTLLEIIIALSMLILILGSVYGTYSATTRTIERFEPRHALQQQAGIFMQRIASEIRCCYAGYKDKSSEPATNTKQKMQKINRQQEDVSLFIGTEVSSGQSFVQSVTSAVTSKREQSLGGLAIVEYMLDSSTNTLSRSKRRYIGGLEVDKDIYNWLVVLENSNDTEGLLPTAIKISLVMQSEDVGPLSFASTVKIVCKANKLGGITVQKTSESDKILRGVDNNKKTDD